MDASKWRIHKTNGAWRVFEPGWVFHPIVVSGTHAGAVSHAEFLIKQGKHTTGRREQ
jgi:hypothetical protein